MRVRGRSMLPTLADGDYVVVRCAGPRQLPCQGDVACIRRRDGSLLVKRLGERLPEGGFRISGDGPASAPAIDLGAICADSIVGRAVLRVSRGRISVLRRRIDSCAPRRIG